MNVRLKVKCFTENDQATKSKFHFASSLDDPPTTDTFLQSADCFKYLQATTTRKQDVDQAVKCL